MITVTIRHPNGQQQEVLLAGVPRVGEGIRLKSSDPSAYSLFVKHVVWQEGNDGRYREPTVTIVVEEQENPIP